MNLDDLRVFYNAEEDHVMENEATETMNSDEAAAFDRFILTALAGSAPVANLDSADPERVLADSDRHSLDSLGTPTEFIQRILSCSRGETVRWQACAADEESVPEGDHIGREQEMTNPDAPEFLALVAAYEACQKREKVSWSYDFRIKEKIGSGGQGVVHRIECLDPFYGKRALKVFSPRPYGSQHAYAADMQRMESVAKIVHQNGHNNLLEVEYFKPHGGIFVMVMKLIEGYDLEYLLQSETVNKLRNSIPAKDWNDHSSVVYGPSGNEQWGLKPCIAVNIIQQCLRGVSALHNKERDIVHCDIKPSNIMIDCNGAIKLIDIGSAYQREHPPQQVTRTPRYVPPEVLERGQWTPQSDLASLGYVLIELLSGRPEELVKPVDGKPAPTDLPKGSSSVRALSLDTRARLAETKWELPRRLAELIPSRARDSEHLIKLCNKLIHPNPAERFASAEDAIFGTYGTHDFQSELHRGKLAAYCPKYMECWVNYAKIAQAKTADSVS